MITIDVNPIAFTIGPISVAWYGIMVALAVVTVFSWILWRVRKGANLSYDNVINIALVGIPSGIIFARVLHILDHLSYYIQNPGEIIGGAGLSIYGAVLGTALGIWIYSRIRKFSFGYATDVIAPGLVLSQMVGRVGCTLNGCCYGLETKAFCAIVYTNPASYGPIGVSVYPTQIFEIIYLAIVFTVLFKLTGRFKPDGSLFLIYLSLYALWRFGIDFIREGTPFLFGLHEAQVISLIILAIVIPLLALRTRWVKREA